MLVVLVLLVAGRTHELTSYALRTVKKLPSSKFVVIGVVLAFTIAVLLSPASAVARMVSLVVYGRIVLAFVVGLLAAHVRLLSWSEIKKMLAWAVAVVIGFGLLQISILPTDFLSNLGYQEEIIEPYQLVDEDPDRVRIISTLRGPNPLGWFMALAGGFMAMSLLSGNTRLQRLGWLIGLLTGGLVLLASYSRSGLLAFAIAISGYIFFSVPKRARAWLVVAGVLVMAVAGLVLGANTELRNELIFHDSAETANQTADTERLSNFRDVYGEILRSPWGHGLGTAGQAAFFDSTGSSIVTESQLSQVAYELGIVMALAFYGALIYTCYWLLFKSGSSKARFVSTLFLGWLFASLVAPVFTDDIVVIYGFFLLGFVVQDELRRKRG